MGVSLNKIILHSTGWIFLFILPYLFSFPGLPNYASIFSNRGDYMHLASYTSLIIFTYLNYFRFIPGCYAKHAYFIYTMIVIISLVVIISIIPLSVARFFAELPPPSIYPTPILFGRNYTILLFLVSVGASLVLYSRMQLHRIENERLSAQLRFLKSQINPHFLFNTLNSIYALAIVKDDKTSEAIVQLSELMRYIIKDGNENTVPLEKEIGYINNYIALQRARLAETVPVHYTCNGSTSGKNIVPLILISLIENAFKHGVNPDEDSKIDIRLEVEENSLTLVVVNNKVLVNNKVNAGGLGLSNTKERLKLFYPGRHMLSIHETGQTYSVTLTIEFK